MQRISVVRCPSQRKGRTTHKVIEKQKKRTKRMKMAGQAAVPQDAFVAVLRAEEK